MRLTRRPTSWVPRSSKGVGGTTTPFEDSGRATQAVVHVRQGRRPRRRRAPARPHVRRPPLLVLGRRQLLQLGGPLDGAKDLLQKRDAPPAAGAGPAALRHLTR